MARLTLRTLLAYLDDTLEAAQARDLGRKVAENPDVQKLVERIKKVTRRRGLTAPTPTGDGDDVADPNTVAEYLSDTLDSAQVRELEETCLRSDVHLAEVAACHQILTLVLTEPVRVPPSAHQRMYKIVEPPASDPARKPGRTIPVGGIVPPEGETAEQDAADAALLLGMKRYAAADSWAGRVGLLAAVGVVVVFLALAVVMALPSGPIRGPEVSRAAPEPDEAVAPPPHAVTPTPNKPPTPAPTGPATEPTATNGKEPQPKSDPAPSPRPGPSPQPGPPLGEPVPPPAAAVEVVGRWRVDEQTIVLTREPEGGWTRLTADRPEVRTHRSVVALPGYHADIRLDSGVDVHLWGNTPEQVNSPLPLFQSRVRFHVPVGGFDADLTLDAGRIYLTTVKPGGAKVRLRIADEVWDVALRAKAEVLVQANTAFVPGTPYNRDGGEKPRTQAQLLVTADTVDVYAPIRFKRYDSLKAGTELAWDSKSGRLTEPRPADREAFRAERLPLLEGEVGRVISRTLGDAAAALTRPDGVRVVLKERLVQQPPPTFNPRTPADALAVIYPVKWAAYSQAAITDGPEAPDLLKDLIDLLNDRVRPYARQGAVTALSSWIAQSPGNTALLVRELVNKNVPEEVADLTARLLRGYSAPMSGPAAGDWSKLDELITLLDHDFIAVREAALGNLLGYYGYPELLDKNPVLVRTDVATRAVRRGPNDPETPETRRWENFLSAWRNYAREFAERQRAEKKP